ncbi:MAG: hypothetical protein N2738_01175, partial [Thermodesulfovibrionales bacterium]|nr:hypothetical protein [Thermodesulfovibrionales bacterium]
MMAVKNLIFSEKIELIATVVSKYFDKSKAIFANSFLASIFFIFNITIMYIFCQTASAEPLKTSLLLGDT